jgi:DNA-binding NarL/FixJ family response regulator
MLIPRKQTIHVCMRENPLSEREVEVMKLLADGQTVKQAATHLGLSAKTVAAHKFNLMRKLRVHNKAQLITAAIQKKIVSIPVVM